MRKLITAALLAAIVATPALAQTGPSAIAPSDEVVVGGKVIGQDPDANVRLELRRDAYGADHN